MSVAGQQPADTRELHVLVVDDSAVVRQMLRSILGAAGMQVEVASDPLIAMAKMARGRPDVIVLDLQMPRMDGLTFLRKLMTDDPIPVVICSGLGGGGRLAALRALDEGAVAIVPKPQLGVQGFLRDSALMLEETVRGAAAARVPARHCTSAAVVALGTPPRPSPKAIAPHPSNDLLVVLGASVGGTEALHRILRAMPPECPPLVIVQHMPEGFTRAFAERLDHECAIDVKEAADGDAVVRGRALVAPGNRHMSLVRTAHGIHVSVADGPLVSRHRPSVDVLFASAAALGPDVLGVLLTGMGADGAQGLLEMKRAGAHTIAQDKDSCIVFGMPREAVARGAVDEIAPLANIADLILAHAGRHIGPTRHG